MKMQVTLSKKEKRHYFLYLIGMLLLAMIFLYVLLLKKKESPFSTKKEDLISIERLERKAEIDKFQKSAIKRLDSISSKIKKAEREEQLNQIYDDEIKEINYTLKKIDAIDPRVEDYKLISKFIELYKRDKSVKFSKMNNLENEKTDYRKCQSGER